MFTHIFKLFIDLLGLGNRRCYLELDWLLIGMWMCSWSYHCNEFSNIRSFWFLPAKDTNSNCFTFCLYFFSHFPIINYKLSDHSFKFPKLSLSLFSQNCCPNGCVCIWNLFFMSLSAFLYLVVLLAYIL